jgi:methylase of polypeptide subunit release factors
LTRARAVELHHRNAVTGAMHSQHNALAAREAFPAAETPTGHLGDSASGLGEARVEACPPSLRPTEYTAALLRQLRLNRAAVAGARVLEMGCGSGVLLAALSSFGASSVCGIDVEDEAVFWASSLLREVSTEATVHRGNLWEPVTGQKFDLIVANLPHSPMQAARFGNRTPSWGCGGLDGRRLLDPFLEGLAGHLDRGGRAVITHNAFVDLDRTRELLKHNGLGLQVLDTLSVYIPQEKLELISPLVLLRERDRTLWRFGPYAFGDLHIVQITAQSGR